MSTTRTAGETEGADEEDVAEWAGQAGLTVRGVMYLVSALLTLRIAFGEAPAEGPGKQGALASVAQQPFGRSALVALAVGLGGYALWRFICAWTYEGDADDSAAKEWAKRIGFVGRGCIYLVALSTAVTLALADDTGSGSGGGGGESGDDVERIFDLPFGRVVVLAIGLGVLAAAAYNGYRALAGTYREKWDGEMSARERRWAIVVSEAGLIGHMAVFALVGFFLTRAAVRYDPDEPESLDQAVRALADESYGTIALVVLAAGMVSYAVFSFVEARWRVLVE